MQSDQWSESGGGMDQFTRELSLTVLHWGADAEPPAPAPPTSEAERRQQEAQELPRRALRGSFIAHVMRLAYFPRPSVQRQNVRIVKMFVEQWSGRFEPRPDVAYSLLRSSGSDERVLGVQLIGVLAANKMLTPALLRHSDAGGEFNVLLVLVRDHGSSAIPALTLLLFAGRLHHVVGWRSWCGGRAARLAETPLRSLCSRAFILSLLFLYRIFCFLMGALQLLGMFARLGFPDAVEVAHSRLEALYQKQMYDRFVLCLAHASAADTGFVGLARPFNERVCFLLSTLSGEFRWRAIEALTSAAQSAHSAHETADLLERVRMPLGRVPQQRDEQLQLSATRFLDAILPKLPEPLRPQVATLALAIDETAVGGARQLSLLLLARLYDEREVRAAVPGLQSRLLSALADPDESVRREALEFWKSRAKTDPLALLMRALSPSELYNPATERVWLPAVLSLLAEQAIGSAGAKELIATSLGDSGGYTELNLGAASATPNADVAEGDAGDGAGAGHLLIRATQTPAFSMTLTQDAENPTLAFAFPSVLESSSATLGPAHGLNQYGDTGAEPLTSRGTISLSSGLPRCW
jgi:hypothetical protein